MPSLIVDYSCASSCQSLLSFLYSHNILVDPFVRDFIGSKRLQNENESTYEIPLVDEVMITNPVTVWIDYWV